MAASQYRVRGCSKCPEDSNYTCISCQCDLCPKCKENHVKDLQTIDHTVVIYDEKLNYIPKHPDRYWEKYCDLCEQAASFHCKEHRGHTILYLTNETAQGKEEKIAQRENQTKRQQYRGTIHSIRSEALLYRQALLAGIKTDIKTCRTEISLNQSKMIIKAKKMKKLIDYALNDLMCNVFCDFDFKHRCLKQKIELNRHIAILQIYETTHEQSATGPVQFLKKKSHLPQIQDSPYLSLHPSQLFIAESLIKENVIDSLSEIKMSDGGKRKIAKERRLKLMSSPELHQSLSVTGVSHSDHISCVTSDRAWVSSGDNLMMINIKGDTLNHLKKLTKYRDGFHTVNNESELIFIDEDCIIKLSKDMKTATTFIETTDSLWTPQCVYCSPSTGVLLVGLYRYSEGKGKVNRYSQTGQLTQTLFTDSTGHELYKSPNYITENNNGDIVVSDQDKGVVVTERGGKHRFSYTGHPSGSGLSPHGICTDALSHILVCDDTTDTVQMTDQDGQFLSHLLRRPPGIFYPRSLSYDTNTHRLWVGSKNYDTICVYRFITRQDPFEDFHQDIFDEMEGLNESQTSETENPPERKDNLQEIVSPKKLPISPKVRGVVSCHHISCVTSDRAWVHDIKSIILTNKEGETLYHLEDLCEDSYSGLHALNSENDLFYIDRDNNIRKLSRDLKSKTLFIETTASRRIYVPHFPIWMPFSFDQDAKLQYVKWPYSTEDQNSSWRPRCVCCSPSTGDLLVGMYKEKPKKGKVTRYDQSGQLTQTIQLDDKKLELYRGPRFITENNNGDIVVCDDDALVVTEGNGRYRFSYIGPPLGSGLSPGGICTDELAHIFVCDFNSKTVHMIDKDGQFLLHLMDPQDEDEPCSLGYDVHTQSLWVGTLYSNILSIYTYTDQDSLTDERQRPESPDGDVLICAGSA